MAEYKGVTKTGFDFCIDEDAIDMELLDDLAEATECRLRAERLVYGEFLRAYKVWKKKAIEEPGWEKLNPFVFEVEKVNGSLVIFNSMEGFDT